MKLTSLSQKVVYVLACSVIILTLLNFIGQFIAFLQNYSDNPGLSHFIQLFNTDGTDNIPAFYEALALFVAGATLSLITVSGRARGAAFNGHWGVLAGVFFYLSFDKAFGIHGRWLAEIGMLISPNNYYFAKTLPMVAIVLIFGASYLKFFFQLPLKFRLLFCAAAAVFLGGSVGMEIVEGLYGNLYADFGGALLIMLENLLEMSGIVFLVYTLLAYQETERGGIAIKIYLPNRLFLKLIQSQSTK